MEITGEWRKLRKISSPFTCLVLIVWLDKRFKNECILDLSSTNLGTYKYIENIIPEIWRQQITWEKTRRWYITKMDLEVNGMWGCEVRLWSEAVRWGCEVRLWGEAVYLTAPFHFHKRRHDRKTSTCSSPLIFIWLIYKTSVSTSQWTQFAPTSRTNRLVLLPLGK
jgi:hypothetical protein